MESADTISFVFDRIDPSTQNVTPALVDAVTERVVRAVKPRRIILFGSQARGGEKSDSDIDLFIQIEDHHPLASSKRRDRSGYVLRLFPYRSFGLDVIVMTQSEVEALLDANEGEWDLVIEILTEGKILYERVENTPVE